MKITLQRTSPNYRQKLSTHQIMRDLTIGLLVIVGYSLFHYYYNYTTNAPFMAAALIYLVSIVVGVGTEAIWALSQKKNVLEQIKNGFPWVTAIIFALTLPIGTPLYVVAIGSFVSIFLGKLVFGGFGYNIFNPALVGRVLVHLSFGAKLLPYVEGMGGETVDIMTSATPAAMLASTNWMGGEAFKYGLMDLFMGNHGGALGETCIWVILLVGLFLAVRRVFDARIPVAYLGTVALLTFVYAAMNSLNLLTYPLMHLCMGGVVFGAIIMATDPVTSPTSPLGKILFGIGLGFLTVIIRLKANYPEGVLFSILMMNMLTPLIDSFVLGRTNANIGKQVVTILVCLVVAMGSVYGAGSSIQAEIKAAQEKAAADKKKEEEAKKKAEEEAKKKAEEEANSFNWRVLNINGNTYTMQTEGFGGKDNPLKVEVKISGDKVESVKVLEYKGETEYFGLDLIEGNASGKQKEFYDKFLTQSFAFADIEGVDTKTGATMTTKGLVNAIKGAIAVSQMDRKVSGNTYTYVLTSEGFGGKDNPMKIEIVVDKASSTVKSVKVLEYKGETEYFGLDLIEGNASGAQKEFHDKFLTQEFKYEDIDGVDTKTGATMTTKGIVTAIRKAIAATK